MKIAPTYLFGTEMMFSKFSVSSEQKPGNAGNFKLFENLEFFVPDFKRLYLHIVRTKILTV